MNATIITIKEGKDIKILFAGKYFVFVLGTFHKRRHPKNVGRSLGIGERFVMFVRLFCRCLDTKRKESACFDFRSCSVYTVTFFLFIES